MGESDQGINMKKNLLFLLLLSCATTRLMAQTDMLKPVVRLEVEKEGLGTEIGAGVIVGKKDNELFIVTAYHVVEDGQSIKTLLYKDPNGYPATVLTQDENLDVAVLSVEAKTIPDFISLIPADEMAIETNKKVMSIGHPGGSYWKTNEFNNIQEISAYEDDRLLNLSPISISAGCSGGPVFLKKGAWLGIITQTGNVEAKCVKAAILFQWLKKQGILTNNIYFPEPDMVLIKKGGKRFVELIDDGVWSEEANLVALIGSMTNISKESQEKIAEQKALLKELLKKGDKALFDYFGDYTPMDFENQLSNDFLLGRTEITAREFQAFLIATEYETDAEKPANGTFVCNPDSNGRLSLQFVQGICWKHNALQKLRTAKEQDYPVVHVSWNDAVAYCKWLSHTTGRHYRLPSKVEWFYAFLPEKKWTTIEKDIFMDNIADEQLIKANGLVTFLYYIDIYKENKYNDGFATPAPAGSFKPNQYGVCNMYGNVSEWTSDRYLKAGLKEYKYFLGPNWLFWFVIPREVYPYLHPGALTNTIHDVRLKASTALNRNEAACFIGFRIAANP